jgi:chromosome segregation ATPase
MHQSILILNLSAMKSFLTLFLLIIVSCLGIKAQKPILLSEDSLLIGKSRLPGLSVTIPEANYESTLKSWIKDMQSLTKSKVIIENGEMSIFGSRLKEISPNPVNVYSKLIDLDSLLKLVVSIELKKDQYVENTTGEAEYTKTQNYIKEFAKNRYIEVVKDQVDTEEKKLRDVEKELSSLEKEKSRMQKSIQTNNNNILSENENITNQRNELTTVSASLAEQNNLPGNLEADPAQKEKAQLIKDLEKRKKKASNSIESSENKINKANSEIDNATNEIPRIEKMQQVVSEQVAQQEAVYQKFVDKLKKIKSY